MKLARKWSIVVAMVLAGFSSRPVLAVSPSAVMVYGEKLKQPLLLRPASPADFPAFGLLWWKAGAYSNPTRTVQGDPELLSSLSNRPCVNLAIFWGPYDADQLKPENASQHGRFYLPTATEPAIVVSTVPDMQKKPNPIPRDLGGFAAVWTLGPQELTTLKGLGFPGLQAASHSDSRRPDIWKGNGR